MMSKSIYGLEEVFATGAAEQKLRYLQPHSVWLFSFPEIVFRFFAYICNIKKMIKTSVEDR